MLQSIKFESLSAMISTILTSLFLFANVGRSQKIENRFEIALVFDSSGSMYGYNTNMSMFALKFLDKYRLADDYTRAAFATFDNKTIIETKLGEDTYEHLRYPIQVHHGEPLYGAKALAEVKKVLLNQPRPGVQQMIVMVTDGDFADLDETKLAVDEFRKNGGLFYLVIVGNKTIIAESRKKIETVAGDQSFIVDISNMTVIADEANILSEKTKTECKTFNQTCRYEDSSRSKCSQIWWPPETEKCEMVASKRHCDIKDCDEACDRLWPWRQCGFDECGNVSIGRQQPMPQEFAKIVENCPKNKSIVCLCTTARIESSPTSQSISPSTSMASTSTHESNQTSKALTSNSTMGSNSTLTESPSTSMASTSTHESNPTSKASTSNSTMGSNSTLTGSPLKLAETDSSSSDQSSTDPGAGQEGQDTHRPTSGKSLLPPWAIFLIIIVVVIILVLVVAAVLPTVRKRCQKEKGSGKKRPRQDSESAIDRNGKKSVSQKSIGRGEEEKSIGREGKKSIGPVSQSSIKKSDQAESSIDSLRNVAVGGSVITADESIGVSLAEGSGSARSIGQSLRQTNQNDQSIVKKQIKEIQSLIKNDDPK